MNKPTDLNVGHMFRVIRGNRTGEIISLKQDDGSDCPFFWNADKSDYSCMYFSNLEPYLKSIRDARVGDIVVNRNRKERMVLERFQNTVVLSISNDFKKAGVVSYTFDELEEDFTLKAKPVKQTLLTMDQIAKKFGIEVSTLKIAKE